MHSDAFTIAFVGHVARENAAKAAAFEGAVLALLPDHGAKVVYRGTRAEGQSESLPFEVQLLEFPNQDAFDRYLADERRQALLAEYGEVFIMKQAVVMEEIVPHSSAG